MFLVALMATLRLVLSIHSSPSAITYVFGCLNGYSCTFHTLQSYSNNMLLVTLMATLLYIQYTFHALPL